ncbi:MAG: collagenase-like protease [Chloroflexi bacterium HGW-Chloroflexi-10]|nr:MAG: collagenase-like protease [Chloroflexi bacterium HGW-Chloroflexi-10]
MDKIELLAPAKDLEYGKAAINCGADAVYIGAARFGAREAAGNPLSDISALVEYAHRYWARVYVTLNTLLYDDELEQAQRMAHELYQAGADALIIQDTGLLELDLPPIPLFASTQMHNHTPERVAFLEKVGIQRAILARELTLNEIRAVRQATRTIELESFVHGALCVSYSGQCYLSCALGGRSGNRGQCAQPCRKIYDLVDRDGQTLIAKRHLLSLKDLNLSQDLEALLDAGVTSFKIEGRLKDKSYVMNVVAAYRQKLDALLEKRALQPAASGRVICDFIPDPQKTFNRGFSNYFLHGRKHPVGSIDTPKSIGEPLGLVTRLGRQSFQMDSNAALVNGDGLCYFNAKGELLGAAVNRVDGRDIFIGRMDELVLGMQIYRNHDHAFLAQLEHSKTVRKLAVHFRLAETRAGLTLFAQDADGNEAVFSQEQEFIAAEKPEQAAAAIETQLRKLGASEFECESLQNDLPVPRFIPLGVLNALRRGALDALMAERLRNFPRQAGRVLVNNAAYPVQSLSFEGNVLNEKSRSFYRRHGVGEIEPAAESGLNLAGRKLMTTRHCLKHQLGWCKTYPNPAAPTLAAALEPLALIDEEGRRFLLRFNCKDCVMEVYHD